MKLPNPQGMKTREVLRAWWEQISERLKKTPLEPPRLRVIQRVSVAPSHFAALLEADGNTYLMVCSREGNPTLRILTRKAARDSGARPDAPPRLGPRRIHWQG